MPKNDAELMGMFVQLRTQAFSKLAFPLRDAVIHPYQQQTRGVKLAAELAYVDRVLFLHTTVT